MMMTPFDWSAFLIGLLAGGALGALFFAGLAFGMTIALKRPHPAAILLPSAALRIAGLLSGSWLVASWLGLAGGVGLALGFFSVRTLVLTRARAALARKTS